MKVKIVRTLARGGLAVAVLGSIAAISAPHFATATYVEPLREGAPAVLTLALYLAFPGYRRSDLIAIAIAAALLAWLGSGLLLAEPLAVSGLAVALLGPALVHLLSHVEAFRAAERQPGDAAFQLVSTSRRGTSSRSRTAGQSRRPDATSALAVRS